MDNNGAAKRIVLVSNRLPFTVEESSGTVAFKESAGGVATGLQALLQPSKLPDIGQAEYLWIGWPGDAVSPKLRGYVKAEAQARFHAYPVFLSPDLVEAFYAGFCNKTIWPLFHYFPLYARYEPEFWEHYRRVNQAFCDAALEVLKPGDLLWIHDYHLMLLPELIRAQMPPLSIGFFLHIPFPHYEVFRLLPAPWRREILTGLLGADVIGFHTFDYAQYFLRCVLRVLGHEHQMGKLLVQDRTVKAGTFPMGVPFDKFSAAAASAGVAGERATLQQTLAGSRVILSIDRQDYSKGILHRLLGFETLLELYPAWRGRVTLLMVVVPSRIGIEDYERMKKEIEERVGQINGRFGSVGWTPILYQYRAQSFDALVALYALADVALITPLRDGMNLIAKEYVACRRDQTGVLVLSEMAGAARELGEAILINPNNRQEIAQALLEALEMPEEEQRRRMEIMQSRLQRYDLARWAADFLSELQAARPNRDRVFAKLLGDTERKALIEAYRNSRARLLLLDYDGTLVSLTPEPKSAKPGPALLDVLLRLGATKENRLVIVSGRDRATLQRWFGALPIGLVAEHGAWVRSRTACWRASQSAGADWKSKLLPILQLYSDRLPGAFVEEKELSLVWHYRRADAEQGMVMARELTDDLLNFTGNIDVQVVQGSKTVEVRNSGISKANAVRQLSVDRPSDFVLAIGDDLDDEELFAMLPKDAWSIRVGIARTLARFNLREPREVESLLGQLAELEPVA
ncbi:MAG: bifunctional alpha,alpha-trehalose-phosphate synthase (UDP-forming)/trehalose-phosphatase [Deltaproteobacteria bacterium]|nr:bifunctional alpha,alpha-trehalose-phosphate synthase (UDP-forming)/trehalose-phosphatase [Deltaproteobacteria bacterium]